jgi:hypothetical protein
MSQNGNEAVDIVAHEECGFVLGSTLRSSYDLVTITDSVHTSADALQRAQAQIGHLAETLRAEGRLKP